MQNITDECGQTTATTPASLFACVGPRWDVPRLALNIKEDILSTYCKCTLSAISHKLSVYRHLLLCIFVSILLWGTCIQYLSISFSYTVYTELLTASNKYVINQLLRAILTKWQKGWLIGWVTARLTGGYFFSCISGTMRLPCPVNRWEYEGRRLPWLSVNTTFNLASSPVQIQTGYPGML